MTTEHAESARPTRLRPVGLRAAGRRTLVPDLIAGLTVWAVLVPESLAYAAIAGVPPVVGLYAAPVALVVYALLGSSPRLVVGPIAATSALSAAVVASQTNDPATAIALTAALAIVVGLIALAAGFLRMGYLASFISEPVLKGFIIGLALTIIAGQVPKGLGLERIEGNFVDRVWGLARHITELHGTSALVGAASLLALIAIRRLWPKLPGPLIVAAAGIAASHLFDLAGRGVAVVGPIALGLPEVGVPDMALSDAYPLIGGALGITLVGFVEGLAGAKAFAEKGSPVDPDRELIAVGAANIGAGLSSGMVVAGSLSKTAVSTTAGGRTQVTGLATGAFTIVTLLVLATVFEALPEPTLAAVVIAAVIDLVDMGALRRLARATSPELVRIYGRASRADLLAASAALGGVLVLDTLPGLFVGVGASVALLVYRASRPNVAVLGRSKADAVWRDIERHPDFDLVDGVVVVRPEGGLLFVNAEAVRDAVHDALESADRPIRGLVVDAEAVAVVDVTAAEVLAGLADELADQGVVVVIARAVGQVRDLLAHTEAAPLVDTVFPTVDEAVNAVRERHEPG